ncbi:D-arabinono-1,4-lactone oxidase [Rugosimonospora africana]|uniref:L-gulonolactone oxidase n=1 Tax=Rugosimonospora africana TaxID=556532 RepID=A0A8J3QK11_9ACTN|nr:D-arabinono-1,4-lactone oxidase [Rugosimonospora africana]GIH12404.1 L-gulonolactone oxidase [Rugosimonospora africana]
MSVNQWQNWAGNQRAQAARVAHPASTDEVSALVKTVANEGLKIKAAGSGHSFTSAAVADGVRVELDRLAGTVSVNPATRRITVQAGMPLRVLNQVLAGHGLALPNLGDIDVQTVAGAISTGTHGTGGRLGCLSTFVEALTLVAADGSVIRCSPTERREVFDAARVGIGALGILTEVTLRCVDAFTLRAEERPEPLADVLAALTEHIEGNDHFEMYWFPYTDRVQTKRNNRVPAHDRPLPRFRSWLDDEFLSNTVFAGACRVGRVVPALIPGITAIEARALTARIYTGPSHEVFCTPRRVRFVEMEYGVPRAALPEAFEGLRKVVDRLPFKVIFPVEVRVSAADDIWLSHGYGRDNAYIAVHQYVGMPYEPYFRGFEEVAESLGGRPHWGKMHWRTREDLRPAYPRFDDFLAVRDQLDPGRVFANRYTSRVLGD